MDGYGIYGKFEAANQRPCDLDVCHGHMGSVPSAAKYGVTTSSSVYHYHVSDYASYPFTWTLGCYGDPSTPVNLATCESLYDGCGSSGTTSQVFTESHPDGLTVKLWCPCFEVPVFEGCTSTGAPTKAPTKAPTVSNAPTVAPTKAPTKAPTAGSQQGDTVAPTLAPTVAPTKASTVPLNVTLYDQSGDQIKYFMCYEKGEMTDCLGESQ